MAQSDINDTDFNRQANNFVYMLLHINIKYSHKLYAFTYNLLHLFKIVAKAYNNEDTS